MERWHKCHLQKLIIILAPTQIEAKIFLLRWQVPLVFRRFLKNLRDLKILFTADHFHCGQYQTGAFCNLLLSALPKNLILRKLKNQNSINVFLAFREDLKIPMTMLI